MYIKRPSDEIVTSVIGDIQRLFYNVFSGHEPYVLNFAKILSFSEVLRSKVISFSAAALKYSNRSVIVSMNTRHTHYFELVSYFRKE